MSGEAGGAEAYLYVISCGLERAKIGVAGCSFEDRPTDIKHVVFPPKSDTATLLCGDLIVDEAKRMFCVFKCPH